MCRAVTLQRYLYLFINIGSISLSPPGIRIGANGEVFYTDP